MSTSRPASTESQSHDLFLSLAEQVKLPLVQILHAAEMLDTSQPNAQTITLASQSALRLLDGYLLAVRLQRESQLEFGPVSVSSLLYDAAQILRPVARAHDCEVELHVGGRYAPVMSHGPALRAALTSIGQTCIEAVSTASKSSQRIIRLAVRRVPGGISAGVFVARPELTAELLQRARRLNGQSHQPMADFVSDSAAGIFVADQLLGQLQAPMRVARMQGLNGLATTLPLSRQLSLV